MIKVFEMFAGYGGASFALKKAGIKFNTVGFSEVDPKCPNCKEITPHTVLEGKMECDICGRVRINYAEKCYNQNHFNIDIVKDFCTGEDENITQHYKQIDIPIQNYGDATKINPKKLPDFDFLTGGFPCQSFSTAGKGKGELDSRGTLFWDILRVIKEKKPKRILLENVKGLTNKNHKKTFDKILEDLQSAGYNITWRVLNSKWHGIPQNRERVWFICIRNDIKQDFNFPPPKNLDLFLKDILEKEVDEKYFLSKNQVEKLLKSNFETEKRTIQQKNFSDTSMSRDWKSPKCIQLNNPKHSNDRVYSADGISPALNTMCGGNRQPFIAASRGRDNGKGGLEQKLEIRIDGTSNTLTQIEKDNYVINNSTIRKLTPKECFRLMGFLNDKINVEGISNAQKYKLAGNGWEINIVSLLLKNLFK